VTHGMTLAVVGIAIGLALAFFAARSMQAMLFGVAPFDLVSFIGVPLVIAFVALAACLVPALRASRIDPLPALRQD
jgi:putative ABC transport system permease protein